MLIARGTSSHQAVDEHRRRLTIPHRIGRSLAYHEVRVAFCHPTAGNIVRGDVGFELSQAKLPNRIRMQQVQRFVDEALSAGACREPVAHGGGTPTQVDVVEPYLAQKLFVGAPPDPVEEPLTS